MFRRFELSKKIYVHPTFFGLWQTNSLLLARYILESQLVNHVLKDVGYVVHVAQVLSSSAGDFDPHEGGIYAEVRFVCYVYSPVPGSILKGTVTHVNSYGIFISDNGLPEVSIPSENLQSGTLYNSERNCYVWTKIVSGEPKYFEVRRGDRVRYLVESTAYHLGPHSILEYDSKVKPSAMQITGSMRIYSLGPLHWYATGAESPNEIGTWQDTFNALKSDEHDYAAFLKAVKAQCSKFKTS